MPTFNLARAVYDQQLLVDTSDMTPLYVNSTGTVVWSPNVYLQQLCKMDMTKFPYDQHNCTFQIYLVMFDVNQASQHDSFLCIVVKIFELDIVTAHTSPILIQYSENNAWKLKSSEMRVLTFVSGISPPIGYISLSLVIQRRPRYFLLNLLFPTLALSFLNILADSGEKVGYPITVLLSVMVMMGVTTDVMPEASDVVPLITQFFTALTVISILTVATTVVILLIHHRREEEENEERKKQTSFLGQYGLVLLKNIG
ncbi:acetylcholine receptor subunit alpha [Plakobranchus ocellatus]|uniref:Acetylcholine receptor subunit alpha n=1 Tax=Plakobranchus ocellatus TaxID=259542 RepID=A0AAV4AVZ9_9GAST|nr:acetylcholine receptor subunit alpha [Plakobranchus ocellatus]